MLWIVLSCCYFADRPCEVLAEALAPCLIHSVGKVGAVLFTLHDLGVRKCRTRELGEDGWQNRLAA